MTIPYFDLTRQYKNLKNEFDTAISKVLESGKFIMGDDVKSFEEEFARYCGVKYAIGVNSGTDALSISLLSLGIGAGDEVITVSYTYIATALAIFFTGARPVFVEMDPVTYCIDPKKIEKAITKKTKAILPVHLYGHPVDMDPISGIAKKHGLKVLEDACQAHGAEYLPANQSAGQAGKGKKTGGLGDIAAFSFFPTKNLGAFGDGGIITTNDAELADKCCLLRDYGRKTRDVHIIKGRNSRLDTIQAAVLRVKLKRLDEWTNLRRKNASLYNNFLKDAKEKIVLPVEAPYAKHVYHLYVVRVKNRDTVVAKLKERGVETLIHYPIPIHLQEAFKDSGYKSGSLPVTEKICHEIISLPMFPEMTKEEVRYAAEQLLEAVK